MAMSAMHDAVTRVATSFTGFGKLKNPVGTDIFLS
jgi:hypothetical protein